MTGAILRFILFQDLLFMMTYEYSVVIRYLNLPSDVTIPKHRE